MKKYVILYVAMMIQLAVYAEEFAGADAVKVKIS